ncbi:importin subunit alpha-1a-like isoform X2 [Daphnia pulicaria]|nr:importin subunit alpha-1a-like isoform X2 [Daphnia pulicaria]
MDSAVILTNIASGTADQAKAVVSAGAVAGIISMVCSLDGRVADNAGFQLAWLASRRQELQEEIIKPLLMLIKPDTPVTLLQRVIDALCTFCYNLDNRTDNSPPTFILPALAHLLHNNDELIIKEACHAFIYFQGSDEVIQEVVDAGVVPRLVALLQHREVAIVPCPKHCPIFSILKTIGSITSGTFDQAKAVVSAGAVTPLISFLGSHRDVAEEALFALSNIADFGPELRNCVIEQGIIRPLLSLIKLDITPDVTLLRLVTRALSSLCYSHKEESPLTVPVIQQLLTGLAHLSHHNNDDEILTAACKALSNLGMNIVENKKAAAIESDIAALDALSSKTLAILERYLSTELSNGESKLAPSTS